MELKPYQYSSFVSVSLNPRLLLFSSYVYGNQAIEVIQSYQ